MSYQDKLNGKIYGSEAGKMRVFWDIVEMLKIEDVMQSTGLKDRKGVEVYEGDIVTFEVENQDRWTGVGRGEMFWNRQVTGFSVKEPSGLIAFFRPYLGIYEGTIEVIGNIYENPELMQSV